MLMGNGLAAEHNGEPPKPTGENAPMVEAAPKKLFETHCSVCHSLELPRSQRLDRSTWRWVVDDMVNKYGATWITEKQQERIIDYLAENYVRNPLELIARTLLRISGPFCMSGIELAKRRMVRTGQARAAGRSQSVESTSRRIADSQCRRPNRRLSFEYMSHKLAALRTPF